MIRALSTAAEDVALNWVSLLMAGLGISFAWNEVLGGLFLSVAVASVITGLRADKRRFWWSILTGALFALLAAIGASWVDWPVPVQVVMAFMGVAGLPIANILIALQDRTTARGTEIADRIIDRVVPDDDV